VPDLQHPAGQFALAAGQHDPRLRPGQGPDFCLVHAVGHGQRGPPGRARVGLQVPPGVVAYVQQGQAGRATQALLRGYDGDAGAPASEVAAGAAERRHGVHQQQRTMGGDHGRDRVQVVHGA
jgi:hypothetical protein